MYNSTVTYYRLQPEPEQWLTEPAQKSSMELECLAGLGEHGSQLDTGRIEITDEITFWIGVYVKISGFLAKYLPVPSILTALCTASQPGDN